MSVVTPSTLLGYNADSNARLWDLLEQRNIGCRDRLKQSADTAGAQLEWSKPSVMGSGKRSGSLYAGPAVIVPQGTVYIVLAREKKVFTIWLRSSSGALADAIEPAVTYVKEVMQATAFNWAGDQVLLTVEHLVKKHGRAPAKTNIEFSSEHNTRIIGILFAAMPADARADMLRVLEMIIADGVCPAMICLLGKGSEKGSSGVWPLLLPLAPYADTVLA